jgi:hypothetical protein
MFGLLVQPDVIDSGKLRHSNLGTTVTFGGIPVRGRFFAGNPTVYLSAPAHAAGTVDVVVSGQGGQLVKLTDAYTYVSTLTFDFNGDWASYGENDQDGLIFFTAFGTTSFSAFRAVPMSR